MSPKEQSLMQLKAAAYALAAACGVNEAASAVRSVAAELEDTLWKGPGNQ